MIGRWMSAIVVVAALGQAASAKKMDDAARLQAARIQYQRGLTAYDLGRYAVAASAFEQSYELRTDKLNMLHNAAKSHFRGGDLAAQLDDPTTALREWSLGVVVMQSFLEFVPKDPERQKLEKDIAEAQEKIAKLRGERARPREAAAAPRPAAEAAPPEDEQRGRPKEPAPARSEAQARLGVGEITGGTTGVLAGSVMLTVGLLTGQGGTKMSGSSNDEDIFGSKLVAVGGAVLLTAAAAVVVDGVRRLWNHGGAPSRLSVAPAGAGFVVSGVF